MAHPTPLHARSTHAALIAANNLADTLGDLDCRLLALEAVEALISPQKAGSREDLSHVDRAGLGWLMTILSNELRGQLAVAQTAANAVVQEIKAGEEQ